MEIEANFFDDWIKLLREQLTGMGHKVEAHATPQDISFMFFNVARRLVEPRPRRVHEASTFTCPAEVASGYALLRGKIERGENLRPHLSTKLNSATFNDGMLNDWGLQHLHLGETLSTEIGKTDFVERTGPLLYALFEPDDCYCIAVMPHRNFSNIELLKVVSAEWPRLVEQDRLADLTPPKLGPSAKEISEARRCGITPLVAVDGVVLASPGGGVTTSGLGAAVVRDASRYADRVRELERGVRENIAQFDDELFSKTGRRLSSPARIELVIDEGGKANAVCHEHRLCIELGEL